MLFGKVLGIEVGSMYTKVVDVLAQNNKYTAGKSFIIPTPPGTFEDGYIRDDEALCNTLFTSFHKYGVAKRRVAFTISSSKIINREIVLPAVERSKVMPMIMANISDYFPVDISKYKVTWNIMERFTEDKIKKMKLMVIAVPIDLLESYYQFATDLNMSVEIIDYSGNSIYQLIKPMSKEEAVMSIHMGENNSIVSILNGGILEVQRTVPYGINVALEALANSSGVYDFGDKYEELFNRLKSEELVNAVLREENDEDDFEVDDETRLRNTITESFRSFIDRVGRIVHYYASMKPDMKLGKIILTGSGASIRGIFPLLQFELGMQVVGVSALKNVKLDPKLLKKEDKEKRTAFETLEDDSLDLCELALCIGSVVAPLDLLSKILQGKKKKRQSLTTAIACCVIGVSMAGVLAAYATLTLNSAKATREKLQKQISDLSAVDQVLQAHDEVSLVYNSVQQMYESTRNPNENLVAFIEDMEEYMPASIKVDSCSVSSTGVNMSMEVGSWIEAADTISQLKKFKSLSAISVSSVNEGEREVTADHAAYYVDGVQVDSLEDIELVDEDGNSKTITVVTEGETYIEKYCSFSVSCTWRSLSELKALSESSNDTEGGEE